MTASRPPPVIGAPMAGGPSTPALVAAVSGAGGLGFLAAGYLTAAGLAERIAAVRDLTTDPFGVNVFVPSPDVADLDAIDAYAASLRTSADRLGVDPGDPRWDDDAYEDKIELLVDARVRTVSFTFGCPAVEVVDRLHRVGSTIAVTVTGPDEAGIAAAAGADVLVVQGVEAGGHQGGFDDEYPNETTLLDALRDLRPACSLPLVAAGGIATADDARAAVDAGASAVQLSTALLLADEAGTSAVHRAALRERRFADTVVTRAFTGRWARGLANRFALEHADAPRGYPQLHHLTRPMRAAASERGDADVGNFWAGVRWAESIQAPAAEIVRAIAAGV